MKPTQLALMCVVLLASGCILVPSPYSAQLKPVVRGYNSIEGGTPRSEIEARLGKPNREEKDGPSVWETRFDDINYALLKVWFDRDGTAERIEITKAHGKVAPGFRATAVTTHTP
jgi:hypothetical protein